MQKRLTPRRDAILRALVEEYIRTAEPVSSQMLKDKYHLGYSSATIRIDMKELEEDGLVFQRHSSGGRIPTEIGYRYFVERLMPESTLIGEEQRLIRHQFYQVQHQLDQWLRLTASIMSQALGGAAVVTMPRAREGRLKHFEVLSLLDTVALMVIVLQDGSALQNRIYLQDITYQEELSRIALRFNTIFANQTADEMLPKIAAESLHLLTQNERTILLALEQQLRQQEVWNSEDFYQEGLTRMLGQPEFTRMGDETERRERISNVVAALEQHRLVSILGNQEGQADGVQVVIGGESTQDQLKDVSMVISRYGLPGQRGGFIGIVGPTRMQYSRAIALVRYMTDLMNEMLADVYGPGTSTAQDQQHDKETNSHIE